MLNDVFDSPFLSVFLRCIAFNFNKIPGADLAFHAASHRAGVRIPR